MTDVTAPNVALTLREEAGRFKRAFDELLKTYLQEERAHFGQISHNSNLAVIFSQLEAVASDGKRLRPFMVWKLYAASQPEATLTNIIDLLLAVELFHIFCLIHDDVMDEATTRHGVATIHEFTRNGLYQQHQDARRSSESQAILVGDIVFNLVFKLLRKAEDANLPNLTSVRNIFHTLIDEVCIGQMLDIDLTTKTTATTAEVLEKNRLKTAYYSFVRPLQIGATISDRSDLVPFILEFGEAVGLLYQIEDDLLDIIGNPTITQKPTFQDVVQNQHTVLTAYIRNQDGDAAQLLANKVGRSLTDDEKAALKSTFIASGAVAYAESLALQYAEAAQTAITNHLFTAADQQLFTAILAVVTKRTA